MDRLTFLEHLRQSRLLSEEQVAAFAARFAGEEPTHALASALVEEGVLTRFQAKQIWAGKSKGLVLGQYRVLDELGRGGFGQVYKAVHSMMDRVVALKVISPELIEDRHARGWFLREVLASTQLHHPNIVMAYDADEVDDVLFLAMEFVDGPNLDNFVRKRGPLPVGLACEMMRQAALALQHAHAKGMVHRDVKPANLLVASDGEARGVAAAAPGAPPPASVLVKVADFGLARLHRTATAGTLMLENNKSCLGTPDYISPEQAENVHAVDIRSDLYSLGCTFYYALAGYRPFRGTTVMEVLIQHLTKEPEPLETLRKDISPDLQAIVSRLMAKDPDDRFQSPADLVAALTPLCSPEAVAASARHSAPSRPTPNGSPLSSRPAKAAEAIATSLVPNLAFWDGPVISRPGAATNGTPGEGDDSSLNEEAKPAAVLCLPRTGAMDSASAADSGEHARAAPPTPSPEPAPVEPASGKPFRTDPELRRLWRQWVGLVEAFVEGKSFDVDERAYRAVHRALLERCRASAGAVGRPVALKRLEAVVEPWLTSETLAQTDRETLTSLLVRCHHLDLELGWREGIGVWRFVALVLFLGLVGSVGGYLIQHHRWGAAIDPWLRTLKVFLASHPVLSLGVVLPALVLGVLFLLSRLLRP